MGLMVAYGRGVDQNFLKALEKLTLIFKGSNFESSQKANVTSTKKGPSNPDLLKGLIRN